MKETQALTAIWLMAMAIAGCSNDTTDAAVVVSSLDHCDPNTLEIGSPCEEEFACTPDDTSEVVCGCRLTEQGRAVVDCWESDANVPPQMPGPFCSEQIESGAHCDPNGDFQTCVQDCPEHTRCYCVPESDEPGCGFVWRCEDDQTHPPPSDGCTEETIYEACLEHGVAECQDAEGRYCRCQLGDDGEQPRVECGGLPRPGEPPPSDRCDEQTLYEQCLEDGIAECQGEDGRYCRCERTGDRQEVQIFCEGVAPPSDPTQCTEEDYARCERGQQIECAIGNARCYCELGDENQDPGEDREGRYHLVCQSAPTPPSDDGERCDPNNSEELCQGSMSDGEPLTCVTEEGRRCYCQNGRLICG